MTRDVALLFVLGSFGVMLVLLIGHWLYYRKHDDGSSRGGK